MQRVTFEAATCFVFACYHTLRLWLSMSVVLPFVVKCFHCNALCQAETYANYFALEIFSQAPELCTDIPGCLPETLSLVD